MSVCTPFSTLKTQIPASCLPSCIEPGLQIDVVVAEHFKHKKGYSKERVGLWAFFNIFPQCPHRVGEGGFFTIIRWQEENSVALTSPNLKRTSFSLRSQTQLQANVFSVELAFFQGLCPQLLSVCRERPRWSMGSWVACSAEAHILSPQHSMCFVRRAAIHSEQICWIREHSGRWGGISDGDNLLLGDWQTTAACQLSLLGTSFCFIPSLLPPIYLPVPPHWWSVDNEGKARVAKTGRRRTVYRPLLKNPVIIFLTM